MLIAVVWGSLGGVSHYPGYPWESLPSVPAAGDIKWLEVKYW
jgi:hypothetical protein